MDKRDSLYDEPMPSIIIDGTTASLLCRSFANALRHQSATPQQPTASTSENGFWGSFVPAMNEQHWLKTAEQATFWGSVAAALMAAVSQQAMFAVPLWLCLGLNWVNQQCLETMLQRPASSMTEIAQIQKQGDRASSIALSKLQQQSDRRLRSCAIAPAGMRYNSSWLHYSSQRSRSLKQVGGAMWRIVLWIWRRLRIKFARQVVDVFSSDRKKFSPVSLMLDRGLQNLKVLPGQDASSIGLKNVKSQIW